MGVGAGPETGVSLRRKRSIAAVIERRWFLSHLLSVSYLLDVVVAQSASIFELLAGEDQALLVGRNAFFVLDLGLNVVDGVRGLDLESDGFAR